MASNPYLWSNAEVLAWVSTLGLPQLLESVQVHSIVGKDLFQLTDADLRFDFKLKQVHERKYFLRSVQELRAQVIFAVRVTYLTQSCDIRVHDLQNYSFGQLRDDALHAFGIAQGVLQDSRGATWAGNSVSVLFDSCFEQVNEVRLVQLGGTKQSDGLARVEAFQESLSEISASVEDFWSGMCS